MENQSFMINREQLELSFELPREYRTPWRRQRRLTRARWWFGQMRAVVDRAFDWRPSPPGRPEQVYFTLAGRR
jgi:hypothetical protein